MLSRILLEAAGDEPSAPLPEIGPHSLLQEELGLKSLQMIQLVVTCENEFGVEIFENSEWLTPLRSVGDLVTLVSSLQAASQL